MTLKRLVVLTDAEINALRFALHNTYMEEDAPGWRPARSAARSAEIKLREAAPTLTAAESAVLKDLTARGEIQWEVGGPPHHSNWNTWKRCCEKLKQIDR